MTVLTTFVVAAAASLVAVSRASPVVKSNATVGVSNVQSSLTLIYQNNLNGSDDKNHTGAIILDPVPQASASAACTSLSEKLITRATLEQYQDGFNDTLSYQDYAKHTDAKRGYHIDNGVVSVGNHVSYPSCSELYERLPVLCTQSANNGSSNAGPVNGSSISVASRGNTFVGYQNQKSFRSRGIRYADTPRRFGYSSSYSQKDEVIQATEYGPQCLQGGGGSEDCLFLNIQTPYISKSRSKKKLRPVLFWIHGAGLTGGSGADPLSDGGNMTSKEDLVVANVNYGTTYLTYYTVEESFDVAGPQIFAAAGCNSIDLSAQITCLQQANATEIVSFGTVARYIVQDGTYVDTYNLILTTCNASTAHIPVIFGVVCNDGASFSAYPETPISTHSQGLQEALGIKSTWAERIIDSGLFPLVDTGNLTLDSFNVSQRIVTDKTFRCVDQSTVYSRANKSPPAFSPRSSGVVTRTRASPI